MKVSIWYHAGYDEIWEKEGDYLCRGSQALIPVSGYNFTVPDHLGLFGFKYNKKKWAEHKANGWLIQLESKKV